MNHANVPRTTLKQIWREWKEKYLKVLKVWR